jgi:tRNA dimethylallyltransferase
MPLVALLGGPTASGKSALALRWARARGLEIISADSRQLYRGFSIGTGAPTLDERAEVPHHLVGCADPREPFSPQRFRAEAASLLASRPESRFLVVGGTGLYLKEWMFPSAHDRGETPPQIRAAAERELAERGAAAVHADLSALDPGGMEGVAPQDRYRLQKRLENWRFTGKSYARGNGNARPDAAFDGVPFAWLDPARDVLHARIEARVRAMFAQGWIDEVRGLLRAYDPATTAAFNALGYREIAEALAADPALASTPSEALVEKVLARTRQYAKKQTTFFRHQFSTTSGPMARAFSPEDLAGRLESFGWDPKCLFPPESLS